ncbi:cell division protein ZapA [Granulicella aggregans]|uniref:Cell division protein ZapA n=1 Tax=Granulicella aggregans TaxID=474949 RepID=A0A7W7Z9K6_9BACT|nr:cell division protein ZapA [Granulicella aggregans]MBB5055869.1 cell division protein ZapA [Granulicella aggregans]
MQESPTIPDTEFETEPLEPIFAPPAVSVEIYDQVYHLRGVDPQYIENLAAMVNEKMRAVSEHGGTVDSLRVAVLAALNIADELCTLRQQYDELAGSQHSVENSMQSRAHSLSGMLDEVLEDRRVG